MVTCNCSILNGKQLDRGKGGWLIYRDTSSLDRDTDSLDRDTSSLDRETAQLDRGNPTHPNKKADSIMKSALPIELSSKPV